jgi:hypothetical protein
VAIEYRWANYQEAPPPAARRGAPVAARVRR